VWGGCVGDEFCEAFCVE
jgi:hypothetical protein